MCEIQQATEHVFGNGLRAIRTNIGYCDTVLFCGIEIDLVSARCGQSDEAHLGRTCEQRLGNQDLVANDDFGAGDAIGNLVVIGFIVDLEIRQQCSQLA